MARGGVVEIFFGIKAEGANLEKIAKPLTATEATHHSDSRAERNEDGSTPPS